VPLQVQNSSEGSDFLLDLLLQQYESLDELLRARRAAGDMHIHGDYLIDGNQSIVTKDRR
jgi:hypothetical protein